MLSYIFITVPTLNMTEKKKKEEKPEENQKFNKTLKNLLNMPPKERDKKK